MLTTTPKISRLIRPTPDTFFHIDYSWWDKADRNLRVYLRSHLCAEHRAAYQSASTDVEEIDWIDPQTAEVKRLDGMLLQLRTHCSRQPDYITEHTSIVDAAFRVFLVNDNQPLTIRQLADRIERDPELVLKTIGGRQTYQGLRPVQ
jgi:hypothetical protein